MKTLIIDNYDSFTYNLVHLLATVNQEEPTVVRNDAASWPSLRSLEFDNIVISPGPGHPARPRDFGICSDVILDAKIPVLGICLGLQGIVDALGGTVSRASVPKHGKTSLVWHEEEALFAGIPSPFKAARYHSLAAQLPLPALIDKTAWTDDGMVMAIAHRERPLWGVQFHPESILTEHGYRLMENFRDLTVRVRSRNSYRPRQTRTDSPKPLVPPTPDVSSGKPARIAFYRELPVPIDTDAAFCTLFSKSATAFWLDSASTDSASSRWSYLGDLEGPSARLLQYSCTTQELLISGRNYRVACRQSILDYLDQQATPPPFGSPPCPFVGGYIGWLGYEMRSECGSPSSRRADTPDALFMRVDRFIAVDHSTQRTYIVAVDDGAGADEARLWIAQTSEQLTNLRPASAVDTSNRQQMPCVDFTLNRNRESYLSDIEQCLEWIRAGESYQVCLTNEVTCPLHVEPFDIYRILRRINPAPFAAFIRWPGGAVLSASPERFLQVTADRRVEARPIKGTSARSTDRDADARLGMLLSVCEKNYAENAMIVDLIRNDLSRACIPGTVKVAKLAALETYATVHQLVSTVTGQLRDRHTAIDLLRATFPGGSMTGVPKLRTLELIDQLERRPRGIYSGILGYLSDDGVADFSIVIRTIVATAGQMRIGAGGGIVAQSNAAAEFDEMLLKARAPMQAITLACTGYNESHRRRLNGI